ncbi:MAG: cytochrome c [Acidobacteria bacterium]|nr:MAG: cytochrome c [Acidobacteriota bacterium]
MRKYVLVFLAGILLVPAVFYFYLRSGYAPVSTSDSPLPFERFFAKLAIRSSLSHEVPKADTAPPTEVDLKGGANLYRENCAICHGLPNAQQTAISRGMYPHPPQFFRPDRPATYDEKQPYRPADPKAYWKVTNGVRLTGMPGFKESLTEQQIRQVTQFLGNARNLPPAVIATLEGKTEQGHSGAPATGTGQRAAADHR